MTVRGIKSTLSSLRLHLYGLYESTLERVEGQNQYSRDLAFKVLTWLSYAQRPMTALELQHAMAVEADKGSLDVENLMDVEDLISVCGGLVAVTAESKIVTFIHTTAFEYFKGQRATRMAAGQAAIASTCLTYLCFDCFADGRCDHDGALRQRLKEYPFLDYASRFWGIHTQALSQGELAHQALELLTHKEKISTCSQIMLSRTPFSSGDSPEYISGLHLVAYFDIKWLATLLLERGSDICARDSRGKDPLAWAVEYNNLTMTRLLLESGADIELEDKRGRTHLALAAVNGHRDITDELLKRHADPSRRDYAGRSALSLAAGHGHLPLVKRLLDIPNSEADSRDGVGRTALVWAADQGHDDVVAYLAAQPSVDINAQDTTGKTSLIRSAEGGWTGVVRILLDQSSILANLKDDLRRTAIAWAAINGRLEVLQFLLSREDAIEALETADYRGESPLDWAIITSNVPVQELLSYRMKVEGNSIE